MPSCLSKHRSVARFARLGAPGKVLPWNASAERWKEENDLTSAHPTRRRMDLFCSLGTELGVEFKYEDAPA